jgi:predicted Fe-S protein YdhL (DUF1289 family)
MGCRRRRIEETGKWEYYTARESKKVGKTKRRNRIDDVGKLQLF